MHGFLSIYFDNVVQEISAIWLAEKLEFYFNLINKLQKAKKQKKTTKPQKKQPKRKEEGKLKKKRGKKEDQHSLVGKRTSARVCDSV